VTSPAASTAPNEVLRAWRIAAGLTQAQMAEAVNRTPAARQEHLICDVKQVAKWESGQTRWPRPTYRRALYDLTGQDPQSLGFTPPHRQPIPPMASPPASPAPPGTVS
jgi:transcriptional regulator with XRE-family HTH domain